MQLMASSDLKSILHSKRANIYFLEHCRVLVNGGRVEYVTERGKESLYWNILMSSGCARACAWHSKSRAATASQNLPTVSGAWVTLVVSR